MRTSLELIEQIEKYLGGTMNSAEKSAFEAELSRSNELQEMLEVQQMIQQAVARKALKSQITNYAPRTGGAGSGGKFYWAFGLGILILGSILMFTNRETLNPGSSEEVLQTAKKETSIQKQNRPASQPSTSVNEGKSNLSPKYSFNARAAKKPIVEQYGKKEVGGLKTWITPQRQRFIIQSGRSNTLECKHGTLIIIPSGSIVHKDGTSVSGDYEIEVVEALNMDQMIGYNLTTMSNGKALSSGGMVYVMPKKGEEELAINKNNPIHIEVPTDTYSSEMVAWKGEITEEGTMNWVNPVPLQKFLVPVDLSTLDFVPGTFRETFKSQLPFEQYTVSSPELEDSFYYALAAHVAMQESELPIIVPSKSKSKDGLLNVHGNNNTGTRFSLQVDGLPKNMNTSTDVEIRYGKGSIVRTKLDAKGQASFFAQVDGRLSATVKVIPKNCDPIVVTDTEFFLDKITFLPVEPVNCVTNENPDISTCYINPSSIQALKTKKFERTLIATKEFEERLRILHTIKNAEELLGLYVQHIEKDLFVIDGMVAARLEGKEKDVFESFAKQGLTNVDLNNVVVKDLMAYYNSKRTEYREEAQNAQALLDEQTKGQLNVLASQLDALSASYYNQGSDSTRATNGILASLSNAFTPSVAVQNSYKVSWNATGWVNIDEYLHALSKGELIVQVLVDGEKDGQKVYQCINSLKTIVPLNDGENGYEAHYPSAENPLSKKFEETYCLALAFGPNGEVFYAENVFSPFANEQIHLKWEAVTEEELLVRLKQLSPDNNVLINSMDEERERINKARSFQEKRDAVLAERQKILDKLAQKQQFLDNLVKAIDPCQSGQVEKDIPPMESQTIAF